MALQRFIHNYPYFVRVLLAFCPVAFISVQLQLSSEYFCVFFVSIVFVNLCCFVVCEIIKKKNNRNANGGMECVLSPSIEETSRRRRYEKCTKQNKQKMLS